jgi:hypothetical protein
VTARDRWTWLALSMVAGYLGSDLIVAEALQNTRNLPYTIGCALIFAALVMFVRGVL